MIIGAPHTSNWDFFVGRCYGYIVGISPSYLIKSSLFVPILGFLIRLNGGIPVYRDSRNNMVDQLVERFIKNDSFMLDFHQKVQEVELINGKQDFIILLTKLMFQ